MTELFDPAARSILVPVIVAGPLRALRLQFVVDTGSNVTNMKERGTPLARVRPGGGDGPAADTLRHRGRAGTHRHRLAPRFAGPNPHRRSARGPRPPAAVMADGLLGLDFFRGLVLAFDFARGRVTLHPPKAWWRFWK